MYYLIIRPFSDSSFLDSTFSVSTFFNIRFKNKNHRYFEKSKRQILSFQESTIWNQRLSHTIRLCHIIYMANCPDWRIDFEQPQIDNDIGVNRSYLDVLDFEPFKGYVVDFDHVTNDSLVRTGEKAYFCAEKLTPFLLYFSAQISIL